VKPLDFALLLMRVYFGLMLVAHGYNKFFGKNGLAGTARWFGSMGMKWPQWQARIAATTEVGSGLLLAAGLATPFAAAGFIGLMTVAIIVDHWKIGFFIFRPGEGWEYCAAIAITTFSIATIGAGKYSIDHAIHKDVQGWTGALIAGILGLGGALLQIALCYRKPVPAPATQ
jgi:putative oxidoreductase